MSAKVCQRFLYTLPTLDIVSFFGPDCLFYSPTDSSEVPNPGFFHSLLCSKFALTRPTQTTNFVEVQGS